MEPVPCAWCRGDARRPRCIRGNGPDGSATRGGTGPRRFEAGSGDGACLLRGLLSGWRTGQLRSRAPSCEAANGPGGTGHDALGARACAPGGMRERHRPILPGRARWAVAVLSPPFRRRRCDGRICRRDSRGRAGGRPAGGGMGPLGAGGHAAGGIRGGLLEVEATHAGRRCGSAPVTGRAPRTGQDRPTDAGDWPDGRAARSADAGGRDLLRGYRECGSLRSRLTPGAPASHGDRGGLSGGPAATGQARRSRRQQRAAGWCPKAKGPACRSRFRH